MNLFDLDINQGDNFDLGITVNGDDGAPMDLSSYQVRGRIKTNYSALSGVDFVTVFDVPESGVLRLSLTPEQTSALPANQLIYDVEAFTEDDASSFKLLAGYVNVYPQVTTNP